MSEDLKSKDPALWGHLEERAEKDGLPREWIEERMVDLLRQREEDQRERRDREYRQFPGKAQYVAHKLAKVISTSTARLSDLPERSPFTDVTDFEWRQALGILQAEREKRAARYVDQYAYKRYSRTTKADLAYITKHADVADIDTIPYYAATLREAQQNFKRVADALEEEIDRLEVS